MSAAFPDNWPPAARVAAGFARRRVEECRQELADAVKVENDHAAWLKKHNRNSTNWADHNRRTIALKEARERRAEIEKRLPDIEEAALAWEGWEPPPPDPRHPIEIERQRVLDVCEDALEQATEDEEKAATARDDARRRYGAHPSKVNSEAWDDGEKALAVAESKRATAQSKVDAAKAALEPTALATDIERAKRVEAESAEAAARFAELEGRLSAGAKAFVAAVAELKPANLVAADAIARAIRTALEKACRESGVAIDVIKEALRHSF